MELCKHLRSGHGKGPKLQRLGQLINIDSLKLNGFYSKPIRVFIQGNIILHLKGSRRRKSV